MGTLWLTGWLVLTGGLALFALLRRGPQRPVLASLFIALAVATPIAARVGGLAEALSVLGLVAGYDAAAYVVGTGAHNRWEGPAAGIATVFAAALLVAALAVPPFALLTVGLMAVVVAAAGPLGPSVARWIAETPARSHGTDDDDDEAGAPEEAPAVRRISTLLAAAPALLALLAYTAAVQ